MVGGGSLAMNIEHVGGDIDNLQRLNIFLTGLSNIIRECVLTYS